MSRSPVEFAREFERFRSGFLSAPGEDHKLLALLVFWPTLEHVAGDGRYETWTREYWSLFAALRIDEADLQDLLPEELERLTLVIDYLESSQLYKTGTLKSPVGRTAVLTRLACLSFYVGDLQQGLDVSTRITGRPMSRPIEQSQAQDIAPLEALGELVSQLSEESPELTETLRQIHKEWEEAVSGRADDCIRCLFAERDPGGTGFRGRMRTLCGRVLFDTAATGDDRKRHSISFDNEIKTPDDPFVGSIYAGLCALTERKDILRTLPPKCQSLRAEYKVERSKHRFSGDSIGLGATLIAYTRIMAHSISRRKRYLSSHICVTGGTTEDGRLRPVAKATLFVKLRRAFFSPIKHVVLPADCLDDAEKALMDLRRRYPARRLRLLSHDRLDSVLEDLNVVREEVVPAYSVAVRRLARGFRSTPLQLLVLPLLVYTLLAITFTKQFAPWWFDWRIASIEVVENRFRALNGGGGTVFESPDYPDPLVRGKYTYAPNRYRRFHVAVDLDGNGRDELFMVPSHNRNSTSVQLFRDDGSGDTCWSRPTVFLTSYPGDVACGRWEAKYDYACTRLVHYVDSSGNDFVVTSSEASPPVRVQFVCYDTNGNLVAGPYVHPGGLWRQSPDYQIDVDGDGSNEVIFLGTNNSIERAVLLALNPKTMSGVAPPWYSSLFVESGMPRGNQVLYITFPETILSSARGVRNFAASLDYDPKHRTATVTVFEGLNLDLGDKVLSDDDELPAVVYQFDSSWQPVSAYFPDQGAARFNGVLRAIGRPEISDPAKFVDSLLSLVQVTAAPGRTLAK